MKKIFIMLVLVIFTACMSEDVGVKKELGKEKLSLKRVENVELKKEYKILENWTSSGKNYFKAEIIVSNTSNEKMEWEIEWEFKNGEKITKSWSADVIQSDNKVKAISNADWNKYIKSNESIKFGIIGEGKPVMPVFIEKNNIEIIEEDILLNKVDRL